jgi:hypothetical protein
MSGIEAVLILLWWAGVAALVVWVVRRTARKKREAREAYADLQALAESRGWRYEAGVPGLVDAYQGAAPLPTRAAGLSGDHVISGVYRGFEFRAFEYRHYTADFDVDGNSKRRSVPIHSFWALNLGMEVPDLRIYRDGWLDTLSRGRAMEVGDPPIDKDFHIVSDDEERARAVVLGGLGSFLTSDPRAAEFGLRLHNGQLITWRMRTGLRRKTFDEPLNYLVDAARHLGVTTPAQPPSTP